MTMGKKFWMVSASLLALTVAANASQPADGAARDAAPVQLAQNAPVQMAQNGYSAGSSASDLEARVKALEDAVQANQDRATTDRTRLSTLEQGYNSAVWSFDNGRPSLATGDGRFTFNVRMRFQSDFVDYQQDSTHPAGFAGPSDLSSGAIMRRAYVGFDGRVYSDFAYDIRFNFGGSNGGIAGAPPAGEGDPLLNRFYVTYTGIPNWHFSVGVLEPVFAGELTHSSSALIFMERPEIDNIASDVYGAGDTRRGIEIGWSKTDTLWAGDNLAITGSFTGGKTGSPAGHGNGGDEQSQILGRVSERLWTNGLSNIQIAANYGKVLYSGNAAGGGSQSINLQDRPQARVDGTRLISTGGVAAKTGDMYSFDFEGNLDNFYLMGEWSKFNIDRQCGTLSPILVARCTSSTAVVDHPNFSGWYLEGTWILTGETKPYTAAAINNEVGGFGNPVPSRPFSLNGDSWGAWEVAVRYSDTNLNWHASQLATTTQLAGVLGGDERILTLGLNWYLNRNVKLQLNDMIVQVKKGTAAIPNRDGQDLNIIGVRLAFAN